MMRLAVTLEQEERDALLVLAQQERRDPRDQAAMLIRRELERMGLLPLAPRTEAPAGREVGNG
jgi:hypothetical protein